MKLNNENINGKRENTGKDSQMLKYVKVPENHIVIDFDLKDENGGRSNCKKYTIIFGSINYLASLPQNDFSR